MNYCEGKQGLKQNRQSQLYYEILGDQPINRNDERNPEGNNWGNFDNLIQQFLFPHHSQCQSQKISASSPVQTIAETPSLKSKSQLPHSLYEQAEISEENHENHKEKKMNGKFKKRKIIKKQDEKFIFQESQIFQTTKKFAISKFLVRIFLKYEKNYPQSPQVRSYNDALPENLKNKSNKKNDLFSMEKGIPRIFGSEDKSNEGEINKTNRFILGDILKSHLKNQVILNLFTQNNRLSYLIGCKTFALRTRSRKLVKKASFR